VLVALLAEPDDVSSLLLPHAAVPTAATRSEATRSMRMGRI
jgi:hypothetical protein